MRTDNETETKHPKQEGANAAACSGKPQKADEQVVLSLWRGAA